MLVKLSRALSGVALVGCVIAVGCGKPPASTSTSSSESTTASSSGRTPAETEKADAGKQGTAAPADVKAARARIAELGPRAACRPANGDLLTEITIPDGARIKAEDLELFGKLSDLEKLQILNCRALTDEMVTPLTKLTKLTSLALTNTVISDAAVDAIVKGLPQLTDLDLSSNANMSNGVMKLLSQLTKLQRLTLVQNRVNDIGAQRLSKLPELRFLDMRGNMEAGDLAMDVVGELPNLTAFKHRSTAVTDAGVESLSKSQTLESLLMQDFAITEQAGPHLAKLPKLSQLEVFRCQGFSTEGVLALKGLPLTRLTLRDLPNVDSRALEVLTGLPTLKRLYLHELSTVGDSGLKHLAQLEALEVLDIWTVPQMTDATVEVIAKLPNLKELSVRTTGITDKSIDLILTMPKLTNLVIKENGAITADGLKKLSGKKWSKLDTGKSGAGDAAE